MFFVAMTGKINQYTCYARAREPCFRNRADPSQWRCRRGAGERFAGGRAALGPLTAVRQGDSSPGPPLGARIACGKSRLAARDRPFGSPDRCLRRRRRPTGREGLFGWGSGILYRIPFHDARTTCRGRPHAAVSPRALATGATWLLRRQGVLHRDRARTRQSALLTSRFRDCPENRPAIRCRVSSRLPIPTDRRRGRPLSRLW